MIGKRIFHTVLDACSAMQVRLAAVLGPSVGFCSALGTLVMGFGGWMWWEGVVRSLLQVSEKGVIGKLILDTVLDACSAMQVGLAAGVVSGLVLGGGRGAVQGL